MSGTGHVGQVLTAATGTWNDTTDLAPGTLSYTYQWQRADDGSGTNLSDIGGATSSTYTLALADNGKYVRVKVTATDDGEGSPATASTDAFSTYTQITNSGPVITEGASTSVTMDEDGSPTAFSLTLHATDADTGDTITWSISSGASNGTASVSGTPTGTSQVISYTPTANWNGSDSFVVEVSDGIDGTDTITVNVTVSPRNDAPSGSDKTITIYEDVTYTFTTADFGFSDPNDSPANNLDKVKIIGLETGGSLKLSGSDVTADQEIPKADIDAGNLKYTPGVNGNGIGYDNFTFAVMDDGGTAGGGLNEDQTPNRITFDVTAVNDEPTIDTPSDMTINEDPGLVQITLTGIDEGGSGLEDSQNLTITATSSHPTIIPHPNIIYTENSASGTLEFTPITNANTSISGPVTITVTVKDDGGTSNGGVDTIVRTFTVKINATNDMPVFTIGPDQVVSENAGAQTVANWATGISDSDPEIFQALTFNVSNDNTGLFSSQPAIDSSGQLTYTPAADKNGIATVTVSLTDDATAGGAALTTAVQTFKIKVQGLPVIKVNPTGFSYEINQGDSLSSTSFTLSNDNVGAYEAQSLNYTITNNSGGWLTCSANGSLASGDSTNIAVQFNTASLVPNTYEAYITITDPNALNDPVKIYVKVGVVGEVTTGVGGNDDDAEQQADGDVMTNNDPLHLGRSSGRGRGGGNDIVMVGIRFQNINIPAGSEIKSAYIKFQSDENRSGSASLNIYGQYTGDATQFSNNNNDISSRAKTSSSASWSPGDWYHGNYYQTPDLKDIIQEMINHPDWNSGNALAFIIDGSGLRTAVSKDGSHDAYWRHGTYYPATDAPSLYITYQPGAYSIIETDKTSYDLWIWEGESLDSETFTVKNAGSGQLNYTITDTNSGGIDWMTCTPASGGPLIKADGPQSVAVNFDTTGLTAADPYTDYTGTITVSDPDAVNNPAEIGVKLRVVKNKPQIEVDKDYVGVTGYEGNDAFAETFNLSNTGHDVLHYTITDDANANGTDWLSCVPSSGTLAVGGTIPIKINFDTDSLDVGTYEANVTITDTNAINNPVTIQVSVTIEPIPLSTACGDVPVYTENLVSPAILLLLDVSGSMAWDIDITSESQQTPDIKDIVQEIVNRGYGGNPGNWQSGNGMAFIVTGSGHRSAYTYDGSTSEAPVLHVQFDGGNEVDIPVNSSSDDAEENSGGGMYLDDSDLDFGITGFRDYVRYCGIRFSNVQIPQGATIENAYIKFGVSGSDSTPTNLTVRGNDVDDAATFSSFNRISNRALTTASVSWNNVTTWTGPTQQPRIEVAQAALDELVTDKTISWGFGTWEGNFPSSDNYTKIKVGCKYNNPTHIANLQAAIDAARPGGNTPLTPALNAGLDYFQGERPDEKYNETYVGTDCQPTFVIVITDGMGNLGTTVTNVGTTTQDLEDQGVNTVGIGFGLPPDETEQLYKLAEVSNDNGDKSPDDYLYALHKVIGSVPQPFMAQSKDELVAALRSITAGIKAEVFHGSAPAPTTSVDYGDIVITAKFQPADWSGDLVATQYDNDTGELTNELWSASENMPDTIKAFTINPAATEPTDNSDVVAYTDSTLATDSYICTEKKLGDIIDSTPIIIEDPAYSYNFDNYLRGFKYTVDRDPIVYIGANDGAIHAFRLTDKKAGDGTIEAYGGEEVWRFYPKAVQDNLNKALTEDHWDMCDGDTYCHRYFVDGSPIAGDIFDGTEWKTMLVTGLREGGEAYFALDITSGKPFDDASNPSKYMWEFTDTELGQTWADPAISRVAKDGGGTSWAVFFGSGYKENPFDQAAKEAYLYGIEANDKGNLWVDSSSNPINRIKISSSTLVDDALSPPLPADIEGDYISDVLYTGNLYGSMYRVKNIGKGMDPVVSKLFDSENTSDHSHPIRAKADYGYTEDNDVIRVFFGTGIYETQVDKYSTVQQYFFSLKDDVTGNRTYTMSDTDLAKLKADYVVDDTTGKKYRVITGTNDNKDSWVIGLDNFSTGLLGSERVISQPLVVAGTVFFTTFIPDEDVCAGNGKSWLFAVDMETGLPPTKPVFDINGDGVVNSYDVVTSGDKKYIPAALSIGAGQPSKPVLHKDTMFITTTGGGLSSMKVSLAEQLTKMTSWKEKNNP